MVWVLLICMMGTTTLVRAEDDIDPDCHEMDCPKGQIEICTPPRNGYRNTKCVSHKAWLNGYKLDGSSFCVTPEKPCLDEIEAEEL